MNKGKFIALLLVASTFSVSINAQVKQQTGWFASINSIKLNDKLSVHAELQIRSNDNWEMIQTILPRVGLNYHFKKNQVLTAGYAYIPNRSAIGNKSSLLGEHRVWQQYIISHSAGRAAVAHRFRLEERFVPSAMVDGESLKVKERLYSTRLRYFNRAIIPFRVQKPFTRGMFAALQNEVFVTISNKENVNGSFFDQNRIYGAIGYRFSKKFDMEMGYMNQYVNRRPITGSSVNNDVSNNIFQLAVYGRF